MKTISKRMRILIVFSMFLGIFLFSNSRFAKADLQTEIQNRNKQIAEIQKQIDEYSRQISLNQGKAQTLSSEIARLNAIINKVQLEIKSLSISIDDTNDDILDTQSKILDAQNKLQIQKEALAENLQLMYELDRKNVMQIILENDRLSDFFNNLTSITDTQDNLKESISSIKKAKIDLEAQNDHLRSRKSELEKLLNIQASQKNNLTSTKLTQAKLLDQTKGEEKKYQELVNKGQKDIEAIRGQITFLLQNGISLDDAISQAKLAAIRADIRPGFLLGLLEVETRIGKNQGSGNWKDDMYDCYIRLGTIYYPSKQAYYFKRAEDEKSAFFGIVNSLGLDADSLKVSKEPSYGCGGAMGPAQFIPTTWAAYSDRVGKLTGHNPPNPWNLEDAFTAAAIKLAAGGATAKTRSAEIGAAKAYVGGSTTCSSTICNYYANLVQEKAAIIEQNL